MKLDNKEILILKLIIAFSIPMLFFFSCSKDKLESDYFHGKITYKYTYESNKLNTDSLARVRPHTGIMTFENDNYQSSFIGKDTLNYIYVGELNRCFEFNAKGEALGCEDYSKPTDSISYFKVYETDEKVLGHDCLVLEFQGKYFWNRYYVSKTLLLDPDGYVNNKAYNWSFYGDKANGGLILKMEHRFKNFVMKGEATDIEFYNDRQKAINTNKAISFCYPEIADCVPCERIELFKKSKDLVADKVWKGLDNDSLSPSLLYFTNDRTYVADYDAIDYESYGYTEIHCNDTLSILRLKSRIDDRPFVMENKMSFTDTTSLFYFKPKMLCSDAETLNKVVPEFDQTEDWLQLVMHEYFHSFQFSHEPTITYLAETIQLPANELDNIYLANEWFQTEIKKENQLLLKAINTVEQDSIRSYIKTFITAREHRRQTFESKNDFDLSLQENFWETIEGPARYAEYYMAGNYTEISTSGKSCDTLFNGFKDYTNAIHFEDQPEFKRRTQIMPAYYYVTGFNMCRLLDKLNVDYKASLFNHPEQALYMILQDEISPR